MVEDINVAEDNTVTNINMVGKPGVSQTKTVHFSSVNGEKEVRIVTKEDGVVVEESNELTPDLSGGLFKKHEGDKNKKKKGNSAPNLGHLTSITMSDPEFDARKEIARCNKFMDEIFARMNLAIVAKRLDPMDLRLMQNKKPPKTRYIIPGLE